MNQTFDSAVSFERCVSIILTLEGDYVDDPHDPGGTTKFGISLRFAGSVGFDGDGDLKTTKADIKALTRKQAVGLYHEHFWLPLACDKLEPGLALMVFDCGVNQGVGTAAKILQEAAGSVQDGVIGPKTLLEVQKWKNHPGWLVTDVAAHRAKRYAGTRNFKRFGLGWMRRLMEIHSKAILPWKP